MRLIFYLWEVVLVLSGQESTVLIPKSYPNLLRIGSRIERLGVQDKGLNICLLDIQTFSFLSIVPKCLEQRFWLFLCLPQVVQLMPFVQEDLQWCDSSKSLIFIL